MNYGQNGLNLTKSFEGCELNAYQDSAGVWSIGYGHTGPEVASGLAWTQAQADEALIADTAWAVSVVNKLVTCQINQNQFDALVDFTYNCGSGNFRGSTLLRMVNAGNFAAAAAQFNLWVHAGGQVVDGLVRRRLAERYLFEEAV